jgi:hypothetical protein
MESNDTSTPQTPTEGSNNETSEMIAARDIEGMIDWEE